MLGSYVVIGLICSIPANRLRTSAKLFRQADKAEPDKGWSVLSFAAGEVLPNALISVALMVAAECLALFVGRGAAMIGVVPLALLVMTVIKVTHQAIKYKRMDSHIMWSIARMVSATLFLGGVFALILLSGGDFLSDNSPNLEYRRVVAPISVCMGGITILLTFITASQSTRQSQKWEAVAN